jgi:hypothetical protein
MENRLSDANVAVICEREGDEMSSLIHYSMEILNAFACDVFSIS